MPTDFVVYLYDPTDPTGELRLFLLRENGAFSETGIEDLQKHPSGIVTYGLAALIDGGAGAWINSNAEVIDIDMALTLAAEQPRREAQSSKSFSFLECLQRSSDPGIEHFTAYCFNGDRTQSETVLLAATENVARNLRDVGKDVFTRLRDVNGFSRFTEVEVPVSRVMHRRQALGLRVDCEAIRAKVAILGEVAARTRFNLRKEFAILDPSDRGQVASAIQNDPHLCEVVDTDESDWRVESVLKLYAPVSPLAANLRKYRDAQKSRVILQRFGIDKSGRIHPDYRVAGTITGRILVQNPSLQNISRSYRDILLADEGKSLLYPDFKQCEPGILAHDSQDQALIADYNAGDLYMALSEVLFGDREHRGPSKLLFLFVCYGMASERVAKIGSSITGLPKDEVEQAISAFFGRYPGIETWRDALMGQVSTNRRVGTPCGNFRFFPAAVSDAAALRGAQSQRIQGTAALILKQIIIEIEKRLPNVDVLLPMHDALLVQVPTADVANHRLDLDSIFCEVYRRYCPSICPQVTFEDFHHVEDQ